MSKKFRVPVACFACKAKEPKVLNVPTHGQVVSFKHKCKRCSSETLFRLHRNEGEIFHQVIDVNVSPKGFSYGHIKYPDEEKV